MIGPEVRVGFTSEQEDELWERWRRGEPSRLITRVNDVYSCDPRSPWQRGSNENANRVLRQYLAKGADLRRFSVRDLDDIAKRINTRPRRVLDCATSAELFWPHVHAEYVP
jgi:IS30 family transposase